MTLRTFSGLLAVSALAFATDGALAADPAAAAPAPVAADPGATTFSFPNLTGERTFNVAEIPGNVRLDFLKAGVRTYIANRLNSLTTRHGRDELVQKWEAYDNAVKADPLQSTVAKPEGERPAAPDYEAAYNAAIADLKAGTVRKVGNGEKAARKTKDPLIDAVTGVVVREVFTARRAQDPKFTFISAKQEVGGDGVAYLDKLIEAKVAQGADRAMLEKTRDEKYIKPARIMLGLDVNKKNAELPSIL